MGNYEQHKDDAGKSKRNPVENGIDSVQAFQTAPEALHLSEETAVLPRKIDEENGECGGYDPEFGRSEFAVGEFEFIFEDCTYICMD